MPSELPASDADPQDARPTILLAAASGARADIEEALAAEYGVLRATDASAAAVSARVVDLVITDAALPGPGGGSLATNVATRRRAACSRASCSTDPPAGVTFTKRL